MVLKFECPILGRKYRILEAKEIDIEKLSLGKLSEFSMLFS